MKFSLCKFKIHWWLWSEVLYRLNLSLSVKTLHIWLGQSAVNILSFFKSRTRSENKDAALIDDCARPKYKLKRRTISPYKIKMKDEARGPGNKCRLFLMRHSLLLNIHIYFHLFSLQYSISRRIKTSSVMKPLMADRSIYRRASVTSLNTDK